MFVNSLTVWLSTFRKCSQTICCTAYLKYMLLDRKVVQLVHLMKESMNHTEVYEEFLNFHMSTHHSCSYL